MDERRDPGQVLHSDWVQQQGFTQTENVVLRDKDLSVQARFLYSLLKMYAWQKDSAYPGQETLAELMGVKVRMVQIYLKELIDKGLIERKQRGGTKSNVYIIKPLNAIYCAGDTQPITGHANDTQSTAGHDPQPVTGHDPQPITPEEDSVKNTQKKKTQSKEIAPLGRKLTPGVNTPKPTPATPLPRDWVFDPALRDWALHARGLTPDQADDEHDQFCAHYWSVAHDKKRGWRSDWTAAEHGWFLRREQFAPPQKGLRRDNNVIPPDKLTAKLQGIAGRIAALNGTDGTPDDDVPGVRALPIAR